MPQGQMLAEWMSAPTKAWCHVSRTVRDRADAPPQAHSQLHPPTGVWQTRGWWWARSVRLRRDVVVVIGVPLCVDLAIRTSPDAVITEDPRGAPTGLCPRRHTGGTRDLFCSLVVTG
ncbi:hypothetical protein FHX52_3173 [Humibacillus xanthopallidus]|uniref:Uncharacterized protein n=1 Tax=Humibacillus xanthopallidus TaxID=412689 RepID=A0A543PQU9_9MICO|nr:hypothetical protein FHX52_3173 [Humibacillus xanthopallidus]